MDSRGGDGIDCFEVKIGVELPTILRVELVSKSVYSLYPRGLAKKGGVPMAVPPMH